MNTAQSELCASTFGLVYNAKVKSTGLVHDGGSTLTSGQALCSDTGQDQGKLCQGCTLSCDI